MKYVDRRTVLRGLGGASIALPFLDIMGHPTVAQAQSAISKTGFGGQPKRFLAIFTPCGHGPDWMKVTNDATGKLVLPGAMSPLERHKDDLLFISGVDNKASISYHPPGVDPGHGTPMLGLMTGVQAKGSLGNGISIDQAIANEVHGDTKFASLQLGVQPMGGSTGYFSYKGPQVGLVAKADPQRVFSDLFSTFQADPTALLKIQARRQSILDGIKNNFTAFSKKMSGDDRRKIDLHLDAIRDVEKQVLAAGSGGGQACAKPGMPVKVGYTTEAYIAVGNAHIDMLAMAFACDLTRVATLVFEGAGGNFKPPGSTRGLHDASHQTYPYPRHSNTPEGDLTRTQNTKWFTTYFAGLIDKLKAVKEPDGRSLLDNTMLYWISEHGCGDHNESWMPVMVAGSAGGYFKTGREVQYPNNDSGLNWCQAGFCPGNGTGNGGAPPFPAETGGTVTGAASGPASGDLYTSFLNAMGVPAKTFGDPRWAKGPLPGLTA